ncbi:MAG TPA: CARDB domain-containing protein [Bacteroidales bacterium]|nr:CARDB domain-containing protein [Bacteroidales bacterium]
MNILRTGIHNIKTVSCMVQKFVLKGIMLQGIFILMLLKPAFAQIPMITAGTVIAQQGDSIDIAIRAHDLPQIGSITMYIQFTTPVLNFGKAQNIHSLLIPGYPLINKISSNTIAVSWIDMDGVVLGTDKLFDLRFKYNGGTGHVVFLAGCEITDIAGNVISPNVIYQNGIVSPSVSVSVISGENEICSGDSVLLTAQAANGMGNYTFSWSSDPAGFSSALEAVWANPTVSTVYSVKVSDGIDTASASKAITIFADIPPVSVTGMLPADSSYDISLPVQFSWSPSTNASLYDLYIWKYHESQPLTPTVSNISQIHYLWDGSGSFTFGDTCKWRVVAKNPCAQTHSLIQIFSLKGLPELHVTAISNSQPVAGQPMTINWTVRNDGEGTTPAGNVWMDRVWLSPDIDVRIGEQEDILLGQFPNVSFLGSGENYLQSKQIQIPPNLIGTYFLFVVTDALDACLMSWPPSGPPVPYNPPPYNTAYSHGGSFVNVVHETSDNPPYHDNFFYKEITFPIPPEPDLMATSIIPPSNVFSGQQVNIIWTIKNNGDGNTGSDNWSDRIYLSSDTSLNMSTALNLGTFSHTGLLNPDSSYTCAQAVTIPSNIFGTYYFYIVTDVANNIFEYVYENNNITRSDSMVVFLTPPADMVVTGMSIPDTITNKDVFLIEWTVRNQGATPPTVPNWTDGIYLSDLPYFDAGNAVYLGIKTITMDSLPHDSSYMADRQIQFSLNMTGVYYIYVCTDVNNNVFEYTKENNNILRSDNPLVIINPDLIISHVACPLIVNNSQPFNIHWSVKNNGYGTANNQIWKDNIMVSKSPVYQQDSVIQIDELNHTLTTLLPGDSINQTKTVFLPDTLSGPLYLYIYADWNNIVYEGGKEYNNVSRSAEAIQFAKPDMAAVDISAYPADSGTQAFIINWKVTNTGEGSIINRNWSDRILISHSPVFYPDSVIQIGVLNCNDFLAPGDTIYRQMLVDITDSMVPGTYYVYIYTDGFHEIFENNSEGNNVEHSAGTIEIVRPDLIVQTLLSPSSAYSGDTAGIQWVIKNAGTLSIVNESWTDRVFLSHFPSYNQGGLMVLGDKACTGTFHPGDSLVNQSVFNIPENLHGDYYIHIFTDFNNDIEECFYNNNNIADGLIHLTPGAWADLQVINIQMPDSAMAGNSIPLDFIVKNEGIKNITDKTWIDKVYLSPVPVWDPGSSVHLRSFAQSFSLNADTSYSTNSTVNLPDGMTTGIYYIYVFTDQEDSVFEHSSENNNVLRSNMLFIEALHPADLIMLNVDNPDSANSGQTINIQWTVKNQANAITALSWFDAVFLSADSVWDAGTDIYLGQLYHYGPLGYEESYNGSQALTLPNGINGDYYLLVVADHEQVNNDNNLLNNWNVKKVNNHNVKIHITLTPPPDLEVTSFSIPAQAFTGIPFNIAWTVRNQGQGNITGCTWSDKIYVSSDLIVNSGDLLIGTKTRTASLGLTQTYTDSITVTLPNNLSGNYVMIMVADFSNTIYELNETNNTFHSFIVASQPPPADLNIVNVNLPDTVIVGKSATIHWTIRNTGLHPANGIIKDIVYFSDDNTWDVNDIVFGVYQSMENLAPDAEMTRSLTANVKDLHLGFYYVFVRTDVLNMIYETEEENNIAVSNDLLFADVLELPLGVTLADTLNNLENLYFRIPVDYSQNEETMLTTMKADSLNGNNEMYLSYDDMPGRIIHDYSGSNPYQGNQEIIVPSVYNGNYYLMLYGNTLLGNSQLVHVNAKILTFQILSLNPAAGGNTGQVTLEITGSKFDPNMEVRLENGANIITAHDLIFVNYSRVFATFDLTNVPTGVFDLVLEKSNGDTCVRQDGFEVVEGTEPDLGVYIIAPPSARPNRVTSFTIEFTNLGNTNITDPRAKVRSLTISPVALNIDQLAGMYHELILNLEEDQGPSGMLRPGVTGTITIYTKTLSGLGYIIEY